jgi:uncharacterized lipoprotein YddW (UPF0748 family)
MHWLPLLLAGTLGAGQVIDEFSYKGAEDARRAWVAAEGTPPVDVAPSPPDDRGATRPALRVIAPFAADPKLSRSVIDRRVRLDLSAPGEFVLEIACDRPEAPANLTLYFRSGDGWYGAGGSVDKKGWQTVRFSKASFRPEGTPAGWHKIDGIRIAAWRGQPIDATILLRRLEAVTHDVALVVPDARKEKEPEVETAWETADRVGEMLSQLGVGSDAVEESAVVHGALGKRRVAVLAYNPRLRGDTLDAIESFLAAGGKVLVCYAMPDRLAGMLGFKPGRYLRPEKPGQFGRIRFDAPDVAGLPREVRQASWNIVTAEPAGHNARTIAHWFTDAGQPTGLPAMLLSDRGAYFSHIILGDDPDGKMLMLAALLGRFDQSFWEQMVAAATSQSGKVGHCGDWAAAEAYVKSAATPEALRQLEAASAQRARAEGLSRKKPGPEALAAVHESRRLLADAYLRAQPSPTREGRAVWNHSGTGAFPGDWERSAKVLADGGFNMILPNMLWAGSAHYASDVLPRSSTFERHGDQIQQCCDAAKRHGLEVHVWKVNYNLSGAPKEFVDKMRREGRLQATWRGEEYPWLCPSHPENKKLELESMIEVARKYPVDGLHFDYIRYPGGDQCYCPGCRERFEADLGRKVADWPRDCRRGELRERFTAWRCRQITDLVAAVHREGKKLRPTLKISAAVFGSYPGCRESVGQDWPEWIKAGLLDFVCPMDYTNSDTSFSNLVGNQLRLVERRIPMYPGIGATASSSRLPPDRVVGQIHHARRLGADGFTVFNFSEDTAEDIVPGVGLGAGKQRAPPPHRGR